MKMGAWSGQYGNNISVFKSLITSIHRTKCGDILGHPEERQLVPTPERELSPIASALIKILLHSALVWTASIPKRVRSKLSVRA